MYAVRLLRNTIPAMMSLSVIIRSFMLERDAIIHEKRARNLPARKFDNKS